MKTYTRDEILEIIISVLSENTKAIWIEWPDKIFKICDINTNITLNFLEKLEFTKEEISEFIDNKYGNYFSKIINSENN
jgi:hypothetical protein